MPRTFTASTELKRKNGSFPVLALLINHDSGRRVYTDQDVSITGIPVTPEVRIVEWGSIDQQIDPERVGGFASAQIKLQDADDAVAALFATSPGIQSTVCELSILYWIPDPAGVLPDTLQSWSDRTIIDRGTFAAPKFEAKDKVWTCEFRNLASFYDRSIGFRLDQNSFADIRCSAEEGKILPIPFGDPVFRVPTVMIERPGEDAIGEAILEQHDATFNLINDGADTAFTTDGTVKTYYIGYQYNYEEVEGYFADEVNHPKTITITSRGSILASGTSSGRFASGGFQFFTIDQADLADHTIPRIGNPFWIFIDGAWKGLIVTQWKLEGSVVVIGYLGAFENDAGIGTPWKLGRWPGYIPRWPPGTPVYEEGDFVYALSHLPVKSVEKIEARARIQATGGGEPQAQWYSMTSSSYTVDLDNRTYNTQLGRSSADPGLATITVDRPPTTYGFEDNRLFATMRGILHNATDPATTAPQVIKAIAQSRWLGDFDSDHVDATVLDSSTASINVAFAITEERKLAELLGEIAFNGGCGVFWDQGIIHCEEWPQQGSGTGYQITPSNAAGYPTKEIVNLEDIYTEAVAIWRPYAEAKEYRYMRKSTAGAAALGRRVKEFEFRLLQRPTAVAAALNQWFHWYLNTQVRLTCDDIMPAFLETSLLDFAAIEWTLPTSTPISHDGVVVRSGIVFPDLQAGKTLAAKTTLLGNLWPYTIDAVTLPSDDECEPSPSDVPEIDPGWGQPISQGETPAGSGTLET